MPGKIDKSGAEDSKHDGDITCVAYNNGHVFTAGADGKIKIWDKDLNFKKVINAHEAWIYALAVNKNGKLYSSSCDGTIKFIDDPINTDDIKELLRCEDVIQCLICVDNLLYSGDDKGVVTMWENDKILYKFNLVEEVKSLAAEKSTIYTARDLDAVVTEIMAGKSGKYSTKATIPGRAPLALIGPIVEDRRSFFVFGTRDGKGVILAKNLPGEHYKVVWTKDDCHEMIINSLCGTENSLFTAGYDGKVKKWIDIDKNPKLAGEVDVGNCVNFICNGPDESVYSGSGDGIVRKIVFS